MYLVRKLKLEKTEQLDNLALASGKLYTATVVSYWRVVRKKNIWLKEKSMKRWHNSKRLHAHSADASVEAFYDAVSSWHQTRKTNPDARPPHRLKKYYKVEWKSSAIKIKNAQLVLSNGRGNEPVVIPGWNFDLPKKVEIGWDGEQYELRACYEVNARSQPQGKKVVGVDLGEVHMAAAYDGEKSYILNGRFLRTKKRYQNKLKGELQSKLDKKKRGSRRWGRLVKSKSKQLKKLDNQIKDVEHKQTTQLVYALRNNGAETVVIGDVRDIRIDNDKGHKNNQKIHQWSFGKARHMLTYKLKLFGIEVELEDEYYTSKTCPMCGELNTPKGRNYVCRKCGFKCHRDVVGSMNIREKYLGGNNKIKRQVVGVMASPIGVRYKAHMRCSSGRGKKYAAA